MTKLAKMPQNMKSSDRFRTIFDSAVFSTFSSALLPIFSLCSRLILQVDSNPNFTGPFTMLRPCWSVVLPENGCVILLLFLFLHQVKPKKQRREKFLKLVQFLEFSLDISVCLLFLWKLSLFCSFAQLKLTKNCWCFHAIGNRKD